MIKNFLYGSLIVLLIGIAGHAAPAAAAQFDYKPYEALLNHFARPHVVIDGIAVTAVDYKAIAGEAGKPDSDFSILLKALRPFNPETLESREDKIAFWINAYNIGAIKMIVDHYPVDSIRSRKINWLGLPWGLKIITIGGREYSLGEIENDILLDTFRDLRIHFAINCASVSCVDLAPTPYRGATLYKQLEEQGRLFLADPRKGFRLDRGKRVAYLSQVFKFDKKHFDQQGGAIKFILPFLPPGDREFLAKETAAEDYLSYDWKANDIANKE